MRNISYSIIILFIIASCNYKADNTYFKLTISDQANPVGILPESIEVGSDGTLVILTNRFNEGKEIYQRTYFIELHKQQLDSIKILMSFLSELECVENYDTTFHYKIKLDKMENNKRISQMYLASPSDIKFSALINYCKNLPEQNKRYKVKHSYYFNTDEICWELK